MSRLPIFYTGKNGNKKGLQIVALWESRPGDYLDCAIHSCCEVS